MSPFNIPGTFGGMRIVEDPFMTDTVEDWSGCRSISRARRRHARGIRTRMRPIQVPKKEAYLIDNAKLGLYGASGQTVVMHPEMAKKLREEAKKDMEQVASETFVRKEKPTPNPDSPWWGTMTLEQSIIRTDYTTS